MFKISFHTIRVSTVWEIIDAPQIVTVLKQNNQIIEHDQINTNSCILVSQLEEIYI